MRKLALGVLAALMAVAAPVSAQDGQPLAPEASQPAVAQQDPSSVWLVLVIGNGLDDGGLVSLPMKSMEQCEEQGAIWMASTRVTTDKDRRKWRGFECLEGK